MKILYFAMIRETVGRAEEEVTPPAHVVDVAQLVGWLKSRGPEFERGFADTRAVRVAVNQEHVKLDHPLQPSDEVAFFPPVTGGSDAGRRMDSLSAPTARLRAANRATGGEGAFEDSP